ncbi:MAG: ATPase domain-containing protein [Methanobacteriota archaeon]
MAHKRNKDKYTKDKIIIPPTTLNIPMALLQSEKTPPQKQKDALERVKTGIQGLDTILNGGIPKNTVTLISGPPGSGKTILCYNFLYQGAQEGDKCLFLTLDKKVEGLLSQAKELDIDFQPWIQKAQIKFLFLNINKKLIYETMTNEILSGEYDRIVLDSITPLSEMPIYLRNAEIKRSSDINIIDPEDFNADENFPVRRLHLHYIMNALETANCTSLVTSELPVGSNSLSRDGISEFIADGVIVLSLDSTMDRRKLTVHKMRSTKHTLKPQDIEITKGGIKFR